MTIRPPWPSLTLLGASLAALLPGCTGTEPSTPVPTTVVLNLPAVTFDAVGATQQLAATVKDQNGANMDTVTVTWSTDNGFVAAVSLSGLVTARGGGAANVRAAVTSRTGVFAQATVTVTQLPVLIEKVSGDLQIGTVGQPLATALTVQVKDRLGAPASGATITFTVTQGNGGVDPASRTTVTSGLAGSSWTLGTAVGTAHQVTVTATSGTAPPVTFTATANAGAPASVAKQAGDGQTAPAGTAVAVAPAVVVRDRFDNLVAGAQVTFAVASGGGSVAGASQTTNASGVATVGSWTLGFAGANSLSATLPGAGITGNPAMFAASALAPGAPASVAPFDGDNQTGLAGHPLNIAPAVRVLDGFNNPVAGVQVDFTVASGGGSIGGASATTSVSGVARVGSWTVQVGPNTLTATVSGSGLTTTLTATGATAAFDIDVRPLSALTASQQAAFTNAAARWETLIFGDIGDVPVNVAAGQCGANAPAVNETVDDIIIFATIEAIDGPGGILGQAGPCAIRSPGFLPVMGRMRFDSDDVANLETVGALEVVILHEMGHVLGFGTIWGFLDLLSGAGGGDPHFVGAQALDAFDRIGGTGYFGGAKVPVENTGGPGTANAHWRESVFSDELMTGFLNVGVPNPLSVVTTASLGDEAYAVNYAGSDVYTVDVLARMAGPRETLELKDDVLRSPISVVDARGRIVRVIGP